MGQFLTNGRDARTLQLGADAVSTRAARAAPTTSSRRALRRTTSPRTAREARYDVDRAVAHVPCRGRHGQVATFGARAFGAATCSGSAINGCDRVAARSRLDARRRSTRLLASTASTAGARLGNATVRGSTRSSTATARGRRVRRATATSQSAVLDGAERAPHCYGARRRDGATCTRLDSRGRRDARQSDRSIVGMACARVGYDGY